jgi:hypothetical protein
VVREHRTGPESTAYQMSVENAGHQRIQRSEHFQYARCPVAVIELQHQPLHLKLQLFGSDACDFMLFGEAYDVSENFLFGFVSATVE